MHGIMILTLKLAYIYIYGYGAGGKILYDRDVGDVIIVFYYYLHALTTN